MKKSGNVIRDNMVGLLATSQANKSRDELLGQEVETLFRKPADQEDDRLMPPKNYLASVRTQALFILKGERVKTNIS